MWYGWTGVGLEVDLSRKTIKKTEGDRQMYEKFLTGRGLITKLFWDRVAPEVEPFSPENLLIFGVSPIVGTAAPAACKVHLVTRSPLTNCLFDSNCGGYFGPELKFAGYDTIVISGKSDTPVYLYINNDKVELRDASHLWGKDAFQTQRAIEEETRDRDVQTLAIGQAGENRVFFASIEHGSGNAMSRCGSGAVMGDKKLKAIAVRGTGNVRVARPIPFFEICEDIMSQAAFVNSKNAARWPDTENGRTFINIYPHIPQRVYRNFDTPRSWEDDQQQFLDYLVKRKAIMASCYNCQEECLHAVPDDEGNFAFFKCGTWFMLTAGDVQDWGYAQRCTSLMQRYGMDTRSTTNSARYAIDLYQKGVLTKEDTGGLHLEFGNPEVVPALLAKIAYRKDIGDVLANGVYRASRQIGRGAEKYAYMYKGLEFSQGDTKVRSVLQSLRKLVSERQGDNRNWTQISQDELYEELNAEEKEQWLKIMGRRANDADGVSRLAVRKRIAEDPEEYDRFFATLTDPDEIKEWKEYLASPPKDETKIGTEILSKVAAYDAECVVLRDITGMCQHRFEHDDNVKKVATNVDWEVGLLAHATGLDLTQEKVVTYARRVRALQHAYNAILGERQSVMELEARLLPKNLLADDRAFLKQALVETNQRMGFSAEGIPTKDHLEALGLADVAQELKRRGILPEPAAISKK